MEYLNIFAQFLFVLVVLRDANTTSTTGCCSTSVTSDNTDPSSTTDLSTTSESPTTTTETPTTSDGPTTSAHQTTTTEIPTTSQDSLTTDTPSTTDLPTTTEHPTTTTTKEFSTTVTEQISTTDPPTTTGGPTTTSTTVTEPPSTTTNDQTTTEYAATIEDLTTIEMTTTTTKVISTSASTAVSTSDKLPTTTIVPDQDDVKNYVIIALSVTLGILIIGIIIWCVYIRVSRKGHYDVSMKSSDLVSSGTQTEDLSLKGFYGRQLPPIGTNLRLISEKTKAFDYDDQMKSRKIGFCENFSDKISNTLDMNHFYYPDAPPVVPKHKPLINFEQNNYKDQNYLLNDDLEAHNDISNSFSLLTDHYRHQVSPPYLFKKKHNSNLPDVEVPSTSASELSYDIEKKDEFILESSPKSVYLKNRYSPDKSETSSGFSEEQTAPLSTQLIQISNMSKYTVDKDRNQESVAANANSFEDFDKTLQETAADLHIPIVVDMDSSVPLNTWKEERPKFENIRIENKNPKIKFGTFNNTNHVDEPFDIGDCKNAPLIQVHTPSNLRRVTFDLEENRAISDSFENAGEEITLRGRRYHAHDREKSEQSDETTVSPHHKKKKKRKLLYARKEMAEKILYATYGVKDVNRNAKVKISEGAKKKRKKSSTYAYQNTQNDLG